MTTINIDAEYIITIVRAYAKKSIDNGRDWY